jgi:hypothetical protein
MKDGVRSNGLDQFHTAYHDFYGKTKIGCSVILNLMNMVAGSRRPVKND